MSISTLVAERDGRDSGEEEDEEENDDDGDGDRFSSRNLLVVDGYGRVCEALVTGEYSSLSSCRGNGSGGGGDRDGTSTCIDGACVDSIEVTPSSVSLMAWR